MKRVDLALVSLLAFPAAAQQVSVPPLAQNVNVSVVNVDVTVTRAGSPAADLTPADFELFEDGQPQKITHFYVVDHGVIRQTVAQTPEPRNPQARFRRKAVLLVDSHFVDKRKRDEALREVRKFIVSDYAGQYDWSIGVIGGGVHVIQPFTSDKATLSAVLDQVISHGTVPAVADLNEGAIVDPTDRPNARRVDPERAERAQTMREVDRDFHFTSVLEAIRGSARAVIDACRALAPMDGKKLIVLVTGGMEIDVRTPEVGGRSHFSDPGENDREAMGIREAMIREANAANVNLYLINAVGVVSPVANRDASRDRHEGFARATEIRNADALPAALAQETGGMYLTDNDLSQSIRTIDAVSSTFYSLGYMPSHFEDGKYHRIDVRLKKPGYTVRSRTGYVDEPGATRLEESMKVAVSASVPEGTLPLRVDVGPKAVKDGLAVVPVTASLPLGSITTIRKGQTYVGRVHIYLSVFDQSDENVGFNHAVQDVQLTEAQARAIADNPASDFRYTMKVDLKPGRLYRAVILLRDELTEEVGKVSTIIDTRS